LQHGRTTWSTSRHHDARAAAEVRRVQGQTTTLYSISTASAGEPRHREGWRALKAGAIGRVIRTIGLGPHRMNRDAPGVFSSAPATAASSATSRPTRPISSCSSPARRRRRWSPRRSAREQPAYPGARGLRRHDGARQRRHGVHPVDWFTAGRIAHVGRRAADDSRYRRLHRDPQERRIAGRPGGSHLFLVDKQETANIDTSRCAAYGEQFVADVLNRTERRCRRPTAYLRWSSCEGAGAGPASAVQGLTRTGSDLRARLEQARERS